MFGDQAFDSFLSTYNVKYRKAAECLVKDRDTLLTFYDFPLEHWLHIRTTNPIESTFATVRLRTTKTHGCVSRAGLQSGPILVHRGWKARHGCGSHHHIESPKA